jgi:hypothetical protein
MIPFKTNEIDVGRGFKIYYAQEKCNDIRITTGLTPESTGRPPTPIPSTLNSMTTPASSMSMPTLRPADSDQLMSDVNTRSFWRDSFE